MSGIPVLNYMIPINILTYIDTFMLFRLNVAFNTTGVKVIIGKIFRLFIEIAFIIYIN